MRESDGDAAAAETPGSRRLPTMLLRSIGLRFLIYGLNAATGIVTARVLNPSGRGELAAMILWPTFLAGVTTLGLPSALVYHMRRSPDRSSQLVGSALVISIATGLSATLAGWYVLPRWLHEHPAPIIHAAQYCLLVTTIYALVVAARSVWEAQGRFDRSNIIQAIPPVTTILALVPLAIVGRLSPRTAAATYVLAGIPTAVWALGSVVRGCGPRVNWHGPEWRELLGFGARSYGVDLCGVLALYVDQALVVGLLAPAAMGFYVVGLNLARVVNAIQGSVALMAFPRMVGVERRDLRVSIARSARLSALVSGAAGLGIVLVGGTLVTTLYGTSFAPTARILPIFVCEVVLAGVAQVLLQGFLAAGRPGIATLVQVVGLALSVPVFLVVIPAFGLTGAAFALLASTTVRLVLTAAAYPAFLQVPVPRIWIGRSDFVDLAGYRSALMRSVVRVPAGDVK